MGAMLYPQVADTQGAVQDYLPQHGRLPTSKILLPRNPMALPYTEIAPVDASRTDSSVFYWTKLPPWLDIR
jgi:hypothetical protein